MHQVQRSVTASERTLLPCWGMRQKLFPRQMPKAISWVATSKRCLLLFKFIHLPGLISKYTVVCGNSHQNCTETHSEGWDATRSYPECTSIVFVSMNQGNRNQAVAHRGGLRIGEPHTPGLCGGLLRRGLGLHRPAATSSSFGLSKPCGGAFFPLHSRPR